MDDSQILPTYLGDYVIIDEIGRGGMKTVARGHRPSDLNPVAIALMRSRFSVPEEKLRFAQEFELLSRLNHPNIVKVYESGEHEGQLYFSMELIDGEPLSNCIDSKAIFNHERLTRVFLDVSDGLGYAHNNGLIHRDVKPSNILLGPNQTPKITDFGLSKDFYRSSQITRVGQGIGTPLYASPEQLLLTQQAVGPYSDVYSLGMTLLETLIAHRATFLRFSSALQLEGERFSLETAAIDFGFDFRPSLLQFLSRVLTFHADRRIQDMDEFRREFEKLEPESLSPNSNRYGPNRYGPNRKPKVETASSGTPSDYATATNPVQERYELGELIGKGGMGEVWKAFDPVRDASVVIKVLPDLLRSNDEELERLRKSFRLIHSLHHEAICPVFDLFEDQKKGVCLVMKYVEGIDLNQYCTRKWADGKDFSPAEVCHILYPIAQAIDFAHSHHGILHRDIKLENIMLNEDGTNPVLVDFGLAEQIRNTLTSLQQAEQVPCTPTHLAPELWKGNPVNRTSDQYALGIVAYQMLSRKLPFDASATEILKTNVLTDPVPGLPLAENVNAALNQALSKNPEERFPDCKQFIESLRSRNSNERKTKPGLQSTTPLNFTKLLAIATLMLAGFILFKKLNNNVEGDKSVATNLGTNDGKGATNQTSRESINQADDSNNSTQTRIEKPSGFQSSPNNLVEAYRELNKGQEFLEKHQPKKAVESFTLAIELCAPEASQSAQGNSEIAVEDIDIFITALVNRGITYLQLKQFSPAVRDFTNADLAGCEKSVALFNRGLAYQAQNLWRNAITDFNEVLAENPGNHEALEVRGNSFFQLEEFTSACTDFEAAYRLNKKATLLEKINRCKSQL